MTARLLVLLFGLTLFWETSQNGLPKPEPINIPQNKIEQTSSDNEGQTLPTVSQDTLVTVKRVIDGDTVELSTGESLRYIGIDSPETTGSDRCYSTESKEANRALVEGKGVRLEKDVSSTDRYGRIMAYVWIGEAMVNEVLVRQGFATAYPYPPDTKYQTRFNSAQSLAQAESRGIWSACKTSSTSTSKPSSTRLPAGVDKDCGDFKTHAEAQAFFMTNDPSADPHRLDQDHDGQACESLP